MIKISIRTRITLWYSGILMLFLYLGVLGSYNAMSDILTQQHLLEMEKGSQMLEDHIANLPSGEELLVLEKQRLPEDLNLIFWSNTHHSAVGQYESWMLNFPQRLNKITVVEENGQKWFSYDKEIFKNGQKIGWTRSVINMTNVMNMLDLMKERGILFIIPNLLLSALGGFLVTRWALKPIKKIARAAKEIGEGNLNKRIELATANDEIGELAHEFNHMADRLSKLIVREKQFSTDVSHEIRTPVAVMIANAEYALENQPSKANIEQLKIIIEKGKEIQKMLVQLMFLAREHEQSEVMELEQIDLSQVTADILEQYQLKGNEKQITFKSELMSNSVIKGDLTLLSRLLTNLLDNAVTYGHQEGHVYVSVVRCEEEKKVILLVIDDGIGIENKDLPYIFDRFYRIDQSRTEKGSGLGLAFVKFIVKLHKGFISVDSLINEGSSFRIEFPLLNAEEHFS